MGFDVKMANVDAAYEQYLSYADFGGGALGEAIVAVREAVSAFSCMHSFKGAAAEALKTYVSQVHYELLDGFVDLSGQCKQEYALKYMQRYYEAPLSEQGSAVLPEDEMESKRRLLALAKDERIPALSADIMKANELLPSGPRPAIPAPSALQDAFAQAHDDVERAKNATLAIEEEAQRCFTDQGSRFANLAQQMRNVIQDWTVDVAAIRSGEPVRFHGTDACSALRIAAQAVQDERGDWPEELMSAHNQMIDRQVLRAEERYAIFEEGRHQWELVGIGASVLGVMAGAAAIVGTGGMAAVVGGIGVLSSAKGTVTRIQDCANNVHASDDPAGTNMGSKRSGAVANGAISSVSSVLRAKGPSVGPTVPQAVASTTSIVSKASQTCTLLADSNHDRMRADAQAELKRIEELKAKRMVAA